MPSLLGSKPNQVSTNGDLGTLAFQDANAINLTGGTAVIDNLTADAINLKVDTDISNIAPSLNLDFANSKTLDPRITYTRASTATYYDGVTTAKAEENLLTYSQELNNAAWSKYLTTVVADSITAPDGTTTAELAYPTSTGASRNVYRSVMVSGTQYAISVYAKAGGLNFICFAEETGSGVGKAWFNLSTGAVGTVVAGYSASITDVGNGWYRCTVIRTASGAIYNWMLADADNSSTSTTSGTNGVYLWGAQLEQRSAVSSYTPTTTQAITNYIPALQTAASGVARFEHNPTTGESLGLLIEEARTNLLLRSEEFDSAYWTTNSNNISVSANAIVSPSGTLTADKLIETADNTTHRLTLYVSVSAGTNTFSCYVKAGERTKCYFNDLYTGNAATFNLSTGAVVSSTFSSASMTAVGNGWYRCSTTWVTGGAVTCLIGLVNDSDATSYAGDGYSGVYIWGAQLEAGAFATSYIPTVASQVTRAADAASMTGTNFSSWYNPSEGTLYSDARPISLSGNYSPFWINTNTQNGIGSFLHTASHLYIVNGNVTQANIDAGTATANTDNKIGAAYKTNDFAAVINGGTVGTDTSGTLPVVNRVDIGTYASNPMNGTIKKLQYFPKRLTNEELVEMTA